MTPELKGVQKPHLSDKKVFANKLGEEHVSNLASLVKLNAESLE